MTVAAVSIDPFVMNVARLNTGNRTTEGATSLAFLKDSTNKARWGKDAGVKLYLSIMKRFNKGGDPNAVANMYGMAVAHTMVEALKSRTQPDAEEAPGRSNAPEVREEPLHAPASSSRRGPATAIRPRPGSALPLTKGVWRTIGPLVSTRS